MHFLESRALPTKCVTLIRLIVAISLCTVDLSHNSMSALSSERTFPYDALDHILSYACEGSKMRALSLGKTCRYWLSRFHNAEVLWKTIALTGKHNFPVPRSLRSYEGFRNASKQMQNAKPVWEKALHPIEDCTLEYLCPMYAENLKYMSPDEMFCDGCKKSVYLVRTQQDLDERASKGHCVMIREQDLVIGHCDDTIYRVAVVYNNRSQAERYMKGIAGEVLSDGRRTVHVSPVIGVHRSIGQPNQIEAYAISVEEAKALTTKDPFYSFVVTIDASLRKELVQNAFMVQMSKLGRLTSVNSEHLIAYIHEHFKSMRHLMKGKPRRK